MAAAVLELSETNLAGAVVTDGISTLNYGGTDRPNIDWTAAGDKIVPGQFSYVKYVRVHFKTQASPTPVAVSGIRVWRSAGAYVAAQGIASNACAHYIGNYAGGVYQTYATPINTAHAYPSGTSGDSNYIVPTADPGTTNLGIATSLAGSLASPGYSDYWVTQLFTGLSSPTGLISVTTGVQTVFTYSWVET
jgi:hypothetical protein